METKKRKRDENELHSYVLNIHPEGFEKIVREEYDKQKGCYWSFEEIAAAIESNRQTDENDWKNGLSDNQRATLMRILSFLAAADGMINENIAEELLPVVSTKWERIALNFQTMMEDTHAAVYSLLLMEYGSMTYTESEVMEYMNGVDKIPEVRQLIDYIVGQMKRTDLLDVEKIFLQAITELVAFSWLFAFICKLGQMKVLPTLTFANDFIRRDEGLHGQLGRLRAMNHPQWNNLDKKNLVKMMKELTDHVEQFIDWCIPEDEVQYNKLDYHKYLKFVSNDCLLKHGLDPLYDAEDSENRFEYMKWNNVNNSTNHYERISADYKYQSRVSDDVLKDDPNQEFLNNEE